MKKYLSFILIIVLFISQTSISYAEVFKNETVYVNLDYDGNVENITIVNHISGNSNDEYFIEYGDYNSLDVLVNDIEPIIEDNKIKWPTSFLEKEDIYYEGKIDKELPLDLNITYFLDGKEISPSELAGNTGNLKIEIQVKNSQDLTMQIQIPMNLNIFSNIHANRGVTSVVGKTITVVYNHLPIGDAVYTLEAYGENIRLDPIIMSATSQGVEIPDSLTGGIDHLKGGINELSDATVELENGSRQLTGGTENLVNGLSSLSNGISNLYSGAKELNQNSNRIMDGFKEINKGLTLLKDNMTTIVSSVHQTNEGLTALNNKSLEISGGLQGINGGLSEVSGGISALDGGLNELNTSHKQLVNLAKSLVNSSDPNVRALAKGVIGEETAIEELSKGASASNNGIKSISENTNNLTMGFAEFSDGLDNMTKGFNELNEGLKPVPTSLDEMVKGHTELINGIEPLFGGITELTNGIGELSNKSKLIPNQVQKIATAQNDISEGLHRLNKEGFSKIKNSLDTFDFEDTNEKEPYTSFVDNKNKNSNVQFVMKTPSIEIEEIEDTLDDNIQKENKSIWQRFLDLFR